MLAWLLTRLWNILVFLLVAAVCIGGYKIIKFILDVAVERIQDGIENAAENQERIRLLKKNQRGR